MVYKSALHSANRYFSGSPTPAVLFATFIIEWLNMKHTTSTPTTTNTAKIPSAEKKSNPSGTSKHSTVTDTSVVVTPLQSTVTPEEPKPLTDSDKIEQENKKEALSDEKHEEVKQQASDDQTDEASNTSSKQNKIRMPQRKGGMQLWQFLYALLEDPHKRYNDLIEWTDNRQDLEFRLNDPEAIALWWGIIKHRANMTYERLSRSLRYYYDRGILKKMGGERYLYRFCVDPEDMYKHIGISDSRPVLKPMPLPVSKWISNRMMPPHGIFFPTLAPPDYGQLMGISQLPPPPPYPGYQLDSIFHIPNPLGYDYFAEQERDQTYHFNRPRLHSFDLDSLTSTSSTNTLYVSNTATSTSPMFPFTTLPGQGRSLSTGELANIHSETQQPSLFPYLTTFNCLQHQEMLPPSELSPESSCQLHYDSNSPHHSTDSNMSGEEVKMDLDEILPLIESMEDSASVSTSSSTFTTLPNFTSSSQILPTLTLLNSSNFSTPYTTNSPLHSPYTTSISSPSDSLSSYSTHTKTDSSLRWTKENETKWDL